MFAGSFQISESIQALSDCSPTYEGNSDYQSLNEDVHRGFFDHSPELYPMVPEQKYRPPPNMCRGRFLITKLQRALVIWEKVLCILHHWGVQLILAYSWARPAILVVGKGRGGMFLFLLFLHFHSCSSFFPVPLFHLLYSLLSLFSLSLGDDTKWPSRVDVSLNPNTIKKL